jgi:GT2 family glycosyltransferase
MRRTVPVAVIIPTYNRGLRVTSVLEKVLRCDPQPAEILVHIDLADGTLESVLQDRFPNVRVLAASTRLGPGGGRHQCLLACNSTYAVSFDDDSYPIDTDFFHCVHELFREHPEAAIFGASIWQRNEPARSRSESLVLSPTYIGCGYAVRLEAYRQVRGYLPRPVAYAMEETDLSLQLFATGWKIYQSGKLRVFHDTNLNHHQTPEITCGVIKNAGLFVFVNYPLALWGWGFLQLINLLAFCIRMGRFRGICSGILQIPFDCYLNRRYRRPVPSKILKSFLRFRRTNAWASVGGIY